MKKQNLDSILRQLINEDEKPLLTEQQIKYLTTVKFKNGQKMFSLDDSNFTNEISYLIYSKGFDNVKDLLERYTDFDFKTGLSDKEKRKYIIFALDLFNQAREQLYYELNDYKNPIKIVDGGVICKFCSSWDTIAPIKQTRSGDEGATIKIICLSCGRKTIE